MRNCRRNTDPINVQAALLRDPDAELEPSPLEDVIAIRPNVCMQKDMCCGCGRGDRYGIPLHFILHFPDDTIQTVCYTCGKTAAGETGLKLPRTESDIFASEEEADMRLIRIARQKIEAKNE